MKGKVTVYISIGILAFVTGCGTGKVDISRYSPIVDVKNEHEQKKFDADIAACRKIGEKTQKTYEKKAEEERSSMFASILVGAAIGAVTGAILGDSTSSEGDYAAVGAVTGAATGAAAAGPNDHTGVRERLGAQVVVDKCMIGRGWKILNPEGLGIEES